MKIDPNNLRNYLQLLGLKSVLRAGWKRHPIEPSSLESVADHSYGVMLLTWLLAPSELNLQKALEIALVHDLAECEVGDITPHDGVEPEEKNRREMEALRSLLEPLGHQERGSELLRDYQEQGSLEACWVKKMDKLEMSLQSLIYEAESDLDLNEFRESAQPLLKSLGLEWLSREKSDPGRGSSLESPEAD